MWEASLWNTIELEDYTIRRLHTDRKDGMEFIHQHFPNFESQRLHGALTKEMDDYLATLGLPRVEKHYIEAFYDTSELGESEKYLIERYDLDTGEACFILRETTSMYVRGNCRVVSLYQTSEAKCIKYHLNGREPSSFPREDSWETTRRIWSDSLKVDYINWGKCGKFGAYAVVTLDNPKPEIFDLWTPCAPKHIAVMHALGSNLCPNELRRNQLLLQLHPPHNGKQGAVTKIYSSFPPDKPMSVEECVRMRPLTSSDEEISDDESSDHSSEWRMMTWSADSRTCQVCGLPGNADMLTHDDGTVCHTDCYIEKNE